MTSGVNMDKLKFGNGNAKLDKRVVTFSLPAGKTCPGASECKSMAIEVDGKRIIKDGRSTKFRCFAASQEVLYTNTYRARLHNLNLIKSVIRSVPKTTELILSSLPSNAKYVRVHVSGDFFTQNYFDAWLETARSKPDVLFYAYTKSIPFWVTRINEVPTSFVLTASWGGKFDYMLEQNPWLRSARVVYSEAEANELGLAIDHDDSLAMTHGPDFALLLHGSQPKDSEAAKAWSALRASGKSGYNAKKKVKANLPVLNGI